MTQAVYPKSQINFLAEPISAFFRLLGAHFLLKQESDECFLETDVKSVILELWS